MIQTYVEYEPMKVDAKVLEVQVKLNTIRSVNHICVSGWDYLVQDGKYGPASKRAVVAFKKYYNLADKSDKLDSSVISNINSRFSSATSLKYCVMTSPRPGKQVNKAVEVSSTYGYMDLVDDILSSIAKTIDKMSDMIKKVANPKLLTDKNSANEFIKRFNKLSQEFNPSLYDLKQSVKKIWQDKDLVDSLSSEAKKQVHMAKSNMEVRKIQKAHRVTSITSRMIKLEDTNIRQMQSAISHKTAEINIVNKIKVKFKPDTVVATAKYIKPISFVFSARDLIVDIVWESWHMDNAEFKVKFKQDLYKFADDLIVGHLAEWIVFAVLYLAGITVVTGGTIVLVILGCMLVASIIGYILDANDISFSEYFEKGVETVVTSIYQLM